MRDFILDDADRAFRAEVRDFLARELAPRAADIEDRDDWNAVKDVVAALGRAGYLRLMFADLYRGQHRGRQARIAGPRSQERTDVGLADAAVGAGDEHVQEGLGHVRSLSDAQVRRTTSPLA